MSASRFGDGVAWVAYLRVYIWIGWLAKLWRDCISDKNKVHLRPRDALHSLQVDHEVVVVFGCGVTLDDIKYPGWIFILLQCISWEFGLCRINSLSPGRFKVNFRWIIFKLNLVVNGWGISCETALIWLSLDHTHDKSTLVQVMACCLTAPSHYLNQCWPKSLSPYGVTRLQWVNILRPGDAYLHHFTSSNWSPISLRWHHNGRDSVSNHQPHDCLLTVLRRRSKKTSKLRVTGLCAGNSPVTVKFPHKWPITRKMFPFDDVIMWCLFSTRFNTDIFSVGPQENILQSIKIHFHNSRRIIGKFRLQISGPFVRITKCMNLCTLSIHTNR